MKKALEVLNNNQVDQADSEMLAGVYAMTKGAIIGASTDEQRIFFKDFFKKRIVEAQSLTDLEEIKRKILAMKNILIIDTNPSFEQPGNNEGMIPIYEEESIKDVTAEIVSPSKNELEKRVDNSIDIQSSGKWRHPELQEDEVYLGNTHDEDFDQIGWETKRSGQVTYDRDGKKMGQDKDFFPVFVKRDEVIKKWSKETGRDGNLRLTL